MNRRKTLSIVGFSLSVLLMVANSGRSRIHEVARMLAIAIGTSFEPLRPKWKSFLVVVAATIVSATCWGTQDFLAEDLLLSPPFPEQTVTASVEVGGETIWVVPPEGRGVIATICFYQGDMSVIAAHPVPLNDGPWPMRVEPHIPVGMVHGVPEFVTSTPYGAVLKGLGPLGEGRERMEIAAATEIAVGEDAELRSSWKGTLPVRVLGFTERDGEPFLVLQFHSEKDVFEGGMSGSPVVQGDKIVGFAAMTISVVSWRRPQIAFARLASDVYLGTQSYLEQSSGQ